MKLHRLMFHEAGEGDGMHIHATGHLEVEHEGAQLLVPVNHKLMASDDPEKHERILLDLHGKATAWAKRKPEFHAWVGAKETHGESEIEITDCNLQHHSANDWKLYVAWKETHEGRTVKLSKVFSYVTPLQAMSCEDLKVLVRGEVAARTAAKVNLAAHRERFDAIHLAHSEEASGLRLRRQTEPAASGGAGPSERLGDK